MSKKRRTRQEKIIAKLKRQMSSRPEKKKNNAVSTGLKKTKEKAYSSEQPETSGQQQAKSSLYSFDQKMIKNDLKKTGIFSIIFTVIILGLYWYFEKAGLK